MTKRTFLLIALLCCLCQNMTGKGGVRYMRSYDLGYGMGTGKSWKMNDTDRFMLSTTQGVRFAGFAVGVGAGANFYHDRKEHLFPIFGSVRYTMSGFFISPYAEGRLGYTLGDQKGIYFSPSVGFAIHVVKAINVRVGLGYEFQMHDKFVINDETMETSRMYGGLTFRMAVDL